ncbi:nitrate reductase [Denitratisoma oestradiolicum]|uniref:Nitrate reductase n=1 Tax=Denitratisoma oestradiolicum TaxID=311182 RepID=A0A6S6XUK0_9PROT|nr:nitrate reductase [Denitratisoma oestradiolicum]TWO79884.1 nitrate reductase [Denitratisoma oestradiolicum]CAB1369635.1 Nitrate reductase [Denitratisoma oestradiolicum]
MNETKSTCPYCGTGCGLIIEHDGQRIFNVRGDPDHPANHGRLCTKGATLHLTVAPETAGLRTTLPQLRTGKNTARQTMAWPAALDHAAQRFAEVIRDHGADAVAFYISGQLLTEDYYVFNKLARGLVGTNNIDSNSRLCMSSAVMGYKLTLGADSVPCAYEDIDAADCLLIAGANTAYAHPIVFRRIEDARAARAGLKLIVVDPRRTDTAAAADLHLALQPGSDIALYQAMLHVLLQEKLVDRDYIHQHTEGFVALEAAAREMSPAVAAGICGLKASDIVTAARWFGAADSASLSLWCQGLNQSATGSHNSAALIQLHLATGKIGRPGCGPFSLTGQPNAMGGREAGAMATLLPGHRDLADADDRAEVARLWDIDALPDKPGLSAVELFDALGRGEIKALWIAGTNPAQSLPDSQRVQQALAACEFVVVQDIYQDTETTPYADLLLPAAGWGEKEGTVTNSERCISRVRAALPPPGQALPDWRIAADFALALGRYLGREEQAQRLFPYTCAEEVFNEHRETTRGRDLDIGGLSYGLLEQRGPQQWPFPVGATSGQVRLYGDGRFPTPNGRARFIVPVVEGVAEAPDARHPYQLNTGRLRDQWHGMSRTGNVPRLFSHAPEPQLDMHPDDMARHGLKNQDLVRVANPRGSFVAKARASEAMAPGQVFMPMHWGGRFMAGAGVNGVTLPRFDPLSRQPELKHCAVTLEKLQNLWPLVALRRAPAGKGATTLALRQALTPWINRCTHATLTLTGREEPVLVFQGWAESPWSAEQLADFDQALGLHDHSLYFADDRRGVSKRALMQDDRLIGVRLAGETLAAEWLEDLMAAGKPVAGLRRWLLAPLTQPPAGQVGRGRVVCNCLDVSEGEILTDRAEGLDLPALQAKRKCGTSCGSCLPEIRRLLATPLH